MTEIIYVGENVKISPVGAGIFTDITDVGYPRVNNIAVTWMVMEDGRIYNPLNRPIPNLESPHSVCQAPQHNNPDGF